jgi:hypothetical protein
MIQRDYQTVSVTVSYRDQSQTFAKLLWDLSLLSWTTTCMDTRWRNRPGVARSVAQSNLALVSARYLGSSNEPTAVQGLEQLCGCMWQWLRTYMHSLMCNSRAADRIQSLWLFVGGSCYRLHSGGVLLLCVLSLISGCHEDLEHHSLLQRKQHAAVGVRDQALHPTGKPNPQWLPRGLQPPYVPVPFLNPPPVHWW